MDARAAITPVVVVVVAGVVAGVGGVVAFSATHDRAFVEASVEEMASLDAAEPALRARHTRATDERTRLRQEHERLTEAVATLERVTRDLDKTAAAEEAEQAKQPLTAAESAAQHDNDVDAGVDAAADAVVDAGG